MKFITDQWKNPVTRYALLTGLAALSIVTSATSLPLVAACGISFGVSLFTSIGVQIGLYLKTLSDEAKTALTEVKKSVTELQTTIKDFQKEKTAEHLNESLLELSKTAKALQENFAFDPSKGEKPLAATLNETLAEYKALAKTVEANLKVGEKPLADTLKETLAQYKTMAKMLEDNLTLGEKPMIEVLNETLVEFKAMAKSVEKNLQFDETKGEEPLVKGVKKTLAGVDQTLKNVDQQLVDAPIGETPSLVQTVRTAAENIGTTVENGSNGIVGRVLGLGGKKKAAATPAKATPAEATPANATPVVVNQDSAPLQSEPASVAKANRTATQAEPIEPVESYGSWALRGFGMFAKKSHTQTPEPTTRKNDETVDQDAINQDAINQDDINELASEIAVHNSKKTPVTRTRRSKQGGTPQ